MMLLFIENTHPFDIYFELKISGRMDKQKLFQLWIMKVSIPYTFRFFSLKWLKGEVYKEYGSTLIQECEEDLRKSRQNVVSALKLKFSVEFSKIKLQYTFN